MKTLTIFYVDEAFVFDVISTAPLVVKSKGKRTREKMLDWFNRLQQANKHEMEFLKTAGSIFDDDAKRTVELRGMFLRSIDDEKGGATLYSLVYDQTGLSPVITMTRWQFARYIDQTAHRFAIGGFIFGCVVGAAIGAFAVGRFVQYFLGLF